MRRAFPWLAFLLLLAVSLPALADKAKDFFQKGRAAESSEKYEEAYDFYRQAHALKPRDIQYRAAYERARFLAAASHVHKGQLLRDAGKLQEAMAEFEKALEIDPSSFIAKQEINRTRDMINAGAAPPAARRPSEITRSLATAQGPAELQPLSTAPITALNMNDDAKIIFQTLGQLAGINVLFDPDYVSRRIPVKLANVSIGEALDIVSFQSRSFWRPVTSNTIFVSNDTQQKRRDLEQVVLKTFYLSNLVAPTEVQDVTNVLRTVLEIQKMQPLPSQNAIVVRDTPDKVALAQKLIDDFDKAKPEVVIDVAVLQVRRDKLRDLGIKPPTSATIALQNNVPASTGTTTTGGGQSASATNSINLNQLANINATNFQVTIPPATATALLNDSNSRVIQNPQIRATDGVKASLKIGDRIPVATGSFQPGIGGVGVNPLVNTQFQYIDVGVNIDITPRVYADREVGMKLSLEISSVTSQTNIGGVNQPIIGQRKIEHDIRLKEGEVNVLGGILEQQDIRSVSGIPGLAQIPFFKYFFSDNSKEIIDNEIVFVLVPHIVRIQDINDLNLRALDVGTANAVELRHKATPGGGAPAVTPAAQPGQPSPQPQPATPPPAPPAPARGEGAPVPASLAFDPATMAPAANSTFTINVVVRGAQDLSTVPAQLTFDPAKLQLLNVSQGSFLSRDGQVVVLTHREDNGTIVMSASRPPRTPGVSGDGPVFTLTFMAKEPGSTNLVLSRGAGRNSGDQPVPLSGAQAVVAVR